ncbi:unnamed protein product [Pedinophyceae sp. YPF-701]|nr:unnamed protein product [Pedinophyceae sp. YPF-701]
MLAAGSTGSGLHGFGSVSNGDDLIDAAINSSEGNDGSAHMQSTREGGRPPRPKLEQMRSRQESWSQPGTGEEIETQARSRMTALASLKRNASGRRRSVSDDGASTPPTPPAAAAAGAPAPPEGSLSGSGSQPPAVRFGPEDYDWSEMDHYLRHVNMPTAFDTPSVSHANSLHGSAATSGATATKADPDPANSARAPPRPSPLGLALPLPAPTPANEITSPTARSRPMILPQRSNAKSHYSSAHSGAGDAPGPGLPPDVPDASTSVLRASIEAPRPAAPAAQERKAGFFQRMVSSGKEKARKPSKKGGRSPAASSHEGSARSGRSEKGRRKSRDGRRKSEKGRKKRGILRKSTDAERPRPRASPPQPGRKSSNTTFQEGVEVLLPDGSKDFEQLSGEPVSRSSLSQRPNVRFSLSQRDGEDADAPVDPLRSLPLPSVEEQPGTGVPHDGAGSSNPVTPKRTTRPRVMSEMRSLVSKGSGGSALQSARRSEIFPSENGSEKGSSHAGRPGELQRVGSSKVKGGRAKAQLTKAESKLGKAFAKLKNKRRDRLEAKEDAQEPMQVQSRAKSLFDVGMLRRKSKPKVAEDPTIAALKELKAGGARNRSFAGFMRRDVFNNSSGGLRRQATDKVSMVEEEGEGEPGGSSAGQRASTQQSGRGPRQTADWFRSHIRKLPFMDDIRRFYEETYTHVSHIERMYWSQEAAEGLARMRRKQDGLRILLGLGTGSSPKIDLAPAASLISRCWHSFVAVMRVPELEELLLWMVENYQTEIGKIAQDNARADKGLSRLRDRTRGLVDRARLAMGGNERHRQGSVTVVQVLECMVDLACVVRKKHAYQAVGTYVLQLLSSLGFDISENQPEDGQPLEISATQQDVSEECVMLLMAAGRLYMGMGRLDSALTCLLAASENGKEIFGPTHPVPLGALLLAAEAQAGLGDYSYMSAALTEVLELCRSTMRGSAVERRSEATRKLVQALRLDVRHTIITEGSVAGAERAEKALVELKTVFGPHHPESSSLLGFLAGSKEPRAIAALPDRIRDAIDGVGRILGTQRHVRVASLRTWLAGALAAGGDVEQAHEHATTALEVARSWLGPQHPDVAEFMAVCAATGPPEQRVPTLTAARDIKVVELWNHPDSLSLNLQLADAQFVAGNVDEALVSYERAQHFVQTRVFPARRHPSVAVILRHKAIVHLSVGAAEEAHAALEEAFGILKGTVPANCPTLVAVRELLGMLLRVDEHDGNSKAEQEEKDAGRNPLRGSSSKGASFWKRVTKPERARMLSGASDMTLMDHTTRKSHSFTRASGTDDAAAQPAKPGLFKRASNRLFGVAKRRSMRPSGDELSHPSRSPSDMVNASASSGMTLSGPSQSRSSRSRPELRAAPLSQSHTSLH